MTKRFPAVVAGAVLVLAGCGADPTLNNSGTATIGGGPGGSVTVTSVASYDSTNSTLGFAIVNATPGAGGTTLAVAMVLNGASLQTGTFTSANVKSAGSTVQTGSGAATKVWAQYYKQNGLADQGSFSLTISDTGSQITASSGAAWPSPHGSFTGTLKPATSSGASGDVTLNVTF